MWTDKKGNKLTTKQFFGRWKEGIQNVTPLQQVKTTLFGYLPILAGLLLGLVVTFNTKTWWLFTVLIGSLIITGVQILGTLQKYFLLSNMEKLIKVEEVKIENQISST